MAAPTTVDEFLALARRSGVIDEARLDDYLQRLSPTEKPVDPAGLAEALVRDGLATRFQVDQFLQGKARGLIIAGHRVLGPLGSGGMAVVYLGEHPQTRQRVALKLLPPSSAADDESLKRFQREARASAALDHPNIVRTFDIGLDGKLHYLIMEYVEGRTIHEVVQAEGPLEIHRACAYVRQAALGLQHAHEAGLIHRDIKPSNVIVDAAGTVKVLDLGLARFMGEGGESEEVLTKGVIGTPDYLAPEQIKDSHHVDIRADIFGLGGTLYFALSGRPPYGDQGTPAKKLQYQLTHDPYPIHMFRPEVPDEVAAILSKMMAKDLRERYATPAEVAEALAPWTQAPDLTATPRRRSRDSAAEAGSKTPPRTVRKISPAPPSTRRTPSRPAAEVAPPAAEERASAPLGPVTETPPPAEKRPAKAAGKEAKARKGCFGVLLLGLLLAGAIGAWFLGRAAGS